MLDSNQIKKIINDLNGNKIIIIPTDTIYGISGIVSDVNNIKINNIKNADTNKPLIILISNVNQLNQLNINKYSSNDILFLEKKQTTIIFKNDNNEKMAVRLVQRDDLKQIINSTGPIFSTSVNIHNKKPINDLKKLTKFADKLDELYFDCDLKNNTQSRIYDSIEKKWIR